MKPTHLLIILLLCLCIPIKLFSQSGSYRLNITATKVYVKEDHDDYDEDEYRWKIWIYNVLGTSNCIKVNAWDPGWFTVNKVLLINFKEPDITKPLELKLEGWEDDEGDGCEYNSGDDGHCGPTIASLYNLHLSSPNVTRISTLPYCNGKFKVEYSFSYSAPQPEKPTTSAPSGNICDNPSIKLTTDIFMKGTTNLVNTTLTWEYFISGESSWRSLGTSNAYSSNSGYHITSIRGLNGLTNITTNKSVFFRVKATNNGSTSDYSISSDAIHLSPYPPDIFYSSTYPSCPNKNNGSIYMYVLGRGSYKYILRVGNDNSTCDSEGSNCGGIKSGNFTGYTYTIQNVAPGNYTLIVANSGGVNGACWDSKYVSVSQNANVALSLDTVKNLKCYQSNDGLIVMSATGGKTPFQYYLNADDTVYSNSIGKFTNLPAGNYTAVIKDACDQYASTPVSITEPVQIIADVYGTNPGCSSPVNGRITTIVTQGGGLYVYNLYKNNQLVATSSKSQNTSWTVNNLDTGRYKIKVLDLNRLSCPGWTDSVVLTPPVSMDLLPENIEIEPLTCLEANNAKILLKNVNMLDYNYLLKRHGDGTLFTADHGAVIDSLGSGTYDLSMGRNITGCLDSFKYPIPLVIERAAGVGISFVTKNVTCNGNHDGSIIAVITDATGTETYGWETRINGNWNTLSATDSIISGLVVGGYRLRLNNNLGCALSQSIFITEPDQLAIEDVKSSGAACIGDFGKVEVKAKGGNAPFIYSILNADTFITSYNSLTYLQPGSYALNIVDKKGCTVAYDDSVYITKAHSLLDFTYNLANYHGYNIACKGGANGIIDIKGIGGGSSPTDTNYTFSLDNQGYQPQPSFSNVPGGNHTIAIMDSRGCAKQKDVFLTEPDSAVHIRLKDKVYVQCRGNKTGLLWVEGNGGTSPYAFSINNKENKYNGRFDSLDAAHYSILVTDTNGCFSIYHDSILTLNPDIHIAGSVIPVSCFGKSDGAISITGSGGKGLLHYSWLGSDSTSSAITRLSPGSYTVKITDDVGCELEKTFALVQPEELSFIFTNTPTCMGKAGGGISIIANGGSPPYQYILDTLESQNTPTYTSVPLGNHIISVVDENKCILSKEIIIEQSGQTAEPMPNFLVATKQNAMDTLILKDISMPKPDSIRWTFDHRIKIIHNDLLSPEISFDSAGTYPVTLTAFFGKCDYSITIDLNIAPYDSDAKVIERWGMDVIKSLEVSPNPSNGNFHVKVVLDKKQNVTLLLYDLNGITYYTESWDKVSSIEKDVSLESISFPSTMFRLRVVTPTDIKETGVVIIK